MANTAPNIQTGDLLSVLAGGSVTNTVEGTLEVLGQTKFNSDVYILGTLTVSELET